jgi:hypothetical protein
MRTSVPSLPCFPPKGLEDAMPLVDAWFSKTDVGLDRDIERADTKKIWWWDEWRTVRLGGMTKISVWILYNSEST